MSETAAFIPGVEIFCTGTHRGKEYTRADLKQIADNFARFSAPDAPKVYLRVPAVRGHEEDDQRQESYLQRTDIPADGWVAKVWVEGDSLYADFDHVTPKMAALVKQKRYRAVSAEIYDEPPDGVPAQGRMLRRVAFLGGEIPEVKGMREVPDPEPYSERGPLARARGGRLRFSRRVRVARGCWACFSEVGVADGVRKHDEDPESNRRYGSFRKGQRVVADYATTTPRSGVVVGRSGGRYVVRHDGGSGQPHFYAGHRLRDEREHYPQGEENFAEPEHRKPQRGDRVHAGRGTGTVVSAPDEDAAHSAVEVPAGGNVVSRAVRRYLGAGGRAAHARVRDEDLKDDSGRGYGPQRHAEADYGAEDEYGYPPGEAPREGDNNKQGRRRDWMAWEPGDKLAEGGHGFRPGDAVLWHGRVPGNKQASGNAVRATVHDNQRGAGHGVRISTAGGAVGVANPRHLQRMAEDDPETGVEIEDDGPEEAAEPLRPGDRVTYSHSRNKQRPRHPGVLSSVRGGNAIVWSRHPVYGTPLHGPFDVPSSQLHRDMAEPRARKHSEGDMADDREDAPDRDGAQPDAESDDAEMRKAMLAKLEEYGFGDVPDEVPTSFLADTVRAIEAGKADEQEQAGQQEQPAGEMQQEEAQPGEDLPMAQEIPEGELPPDDGRPMDDDDEFAEDEGREFEPGETVRQSVSMQHKGKPPPGEYGPVDSATRRPMTAGGRGMRARVHDDQSGLGEHETRLIDSTGPYVVDNRYLHPDDDYADHSEDDQGYDDEQRMDDDAQQEWHQRRRPHGPGDAPGGGYEDDDPFDEFDETDGGMMGERCHDEGGCDDMDDDPRRRRRDDEDDGGYDGGYDEYEEYDENGHSPDRRQREQDRREIRRMRAPIRRPPPRPPARNAEGDPEVPDPRERRPDPHGPLRDVRVTPPRRPEREGDDVGGRRQPGGRGGSYAEGEGGEYQGGERATYAVHQQSKGKRGADYGHQGHGLVRVHQDQSGVTHGFVRVIHQDGRGPTSVVPAETLQPHSDHAEGPRDLHARGPGGEDSEEGGRPYRGRHPFDPGDEPPPYEPPPIPHWRDELYKKTPRRFAEERGDQPVKLSELRREITGIVRGVVGGEMRRAVAEARAVRGELTKHSESIAQAEKARAVDAEVERLSREGRLPPAQKELFRKRLMRTDRRQVVEKFSEGGRVVGLTAFDLAIREQEALPSLFSELAPAGEAPGQGEREKVVRFSESAKFSQALRAAGSSPADYVKGFEALQAKRPGYTAAEYGVPAVIVG